MQYLTRTQLGLYSANEDRSLCEPMVPFFAVLDGEMQEGHAADVVLAVLRGALPSIASAVAEGPDLVRQVLSTVVEQANRAALAEGEQAPLVGASTTLTSFALTPTAAVVAHVGDSRLYARDVAGWRCVTVDHSLVQQARQGQLPDIPIDDLLADASTVILRILGLMPNVQVDAFEVPRASFCELLLCTDGFWRPLDPQLTAARLPNLPGPDLLDWAYRAYRVDGERDNATSVLVSLEEEGPRARG